MYRRSVDVDWPNVLTGCKDSRHRHTFLVTSRCPSSRFGLMTNTTEQNEDWRKNRRLWHGRRIQMISVSTLKRLTMTVCFGNVKFRATPTAKSSVFASLWNLLNVRQWQQNDSVRRTVLQSDLLT